MPRKPTQPFGHLAFSKSGRVTKAMRQLPAVKEEQESEVVERFAAAFNEHNASFAIEDIRRLAETDHDAAASYAGAPLQIQVTELAARAYTFKMTQEEYDQCTWVEAVQLTYGELPHRVDVELRDKALWESIDRKLRKHYPKPSQGQLWLLVFAVGPLYQTEHIEAGRLTVSPALRFARERLVQFGSGPFTEIWFTNLQTRPIKVWPHLSSVLGTR